MSFNFTGYNNQRGRPSRGEGTSRYQREDYNNCYDGYRSQHYQNFHQRQPQMQNTQKKGKGSPAHQKWTKERGVACRVQLSTAFMEETETKLKERLFQGMSDSDLTKRVGENVINKALPLSV